PTAATATRQRMTRPAAGKRCFATMPWCYARGGHCESARSAHYPSTRENGENGKGLAPLTRSLLQRERHLDTHAQRLAAALDRHAFGRHAARHHRPRRPRAHDLLGDREHGTELRAR